jgi:hypothetical protein
MQQDLALPFLIPSIWKVFQSHLQAKGEAETSYSYDYLWKSLVGSDRKAVTACLGKGFLLLLPIPFPWQLGGGAEAMRLESDSKLKGQHPFPLAPKLRTLFFFIFLLFICAYKAWFISPAQNSYDSVSYTIVCLKTQDFGHSFSVMVAGSQAIPCTYVIPVTPPPLPPLQYIWQTGFPLSPSHRHVQFQVH